MQKQSSPLRQAIGIINSGWLVIFLTYLLDNVLYSLALQLLGSWALLVLIPVKIFLYSGIYGNLIEIASGEEIFFSFESFQRNARRFWKFYAVLMVFSFAVEFFLSTVLSSNPHLTAAVLTGHINIVFLYVLARLIINEKYADLTQSSKKKIHLNLSTANTIFILYFLEMLIFYRPYIIDLDHPNFNNILNLAAKYIHFLQFICFSILILEQYPEIQKKFTSGKELYLIFPPLNGREGPIADFISRFISPQNPAMFVVLKALTPSDYRIRKFNKVIWNDRYYQGNKLVAIGCFSSNCAEAYHIAKKFRKCGSTVVMGGPHVSYLPEEALEYCDSVVIGETEGVWEQIIKDYEADSLRKTYTGGKVEECHHLVYQELLNSSPEVIKDFLETNRGCKFKCHFCMIPTINEGKARTNPTFELVELIKKVAPRYRRLMFIDNNIYNDPAYASELFKALKPLGIKWYSPCTIDIAKNEETLRLAKESGCDTLFIGYEIPEGAPEKEHGGKLAMADKYIEYTRKIHEAGIKIKASFTLGWESQSWQGMVRLYKFCSTLKPFLTVPYLLTPFPGTPLFDEMIRENRIVNLNWKKFNQWHIVVKNNKLNNSLLEHAFIGIAAFSYFFLSGFGRKIIIVVLISVVTFSLLFALLLLKNHLFPI